ncbi:MAG: helix-turn-helix transcriptional regulator [Clostridiales bacterium]|nr:helix-turn-helix transcriptional regulator [Clostridiales bacterium]
MFDKALLRSLRKEQGLSQADVAAAVGLTPSAIGNYERGVHEPSRPTAKKLADYFGVDATAFWTDLARPAPQAETACRPATQGDVLRAMRTLADAGARFSVHKADEPLTITAAFTPAGEQMEQAAAQLAMLLTMQRQNAALGADALAAMRSSIDAWMEKTLPELDKLSLTGAEPPGEGE